MQLDERSTLSAAEYYSERHARGWMDRWPEYKRRRVVNLIRSAATERLDRVLEYGCGVGVFAHAVKDDMPHLEVHGCDISFTAIDRAREKCPGVDFHLLFGGGAEPPLGTYDLIYTHHVLEHVQDLAETMRHISSLLRPNGKVLHIAPCANSNSLEHRISRLTHKGNDPAGCLWCDDSSHVRRLTSEELTESCRRHGLAIRTAFFANQLWGGIDYLTGEYHWTLMSWLNPLQGVTAGSKLKLLGAFLLLVGLALLRQGPRYVFTSLRRPMGILKRGLFLLAVPLAVLTVPISLIVDQSIKWLGKREWNHNKEAHNGSEMYCLFEKTDHGSSQR